MYGSAEDGFVVGAAEDGELGLEGRVETKSEVVESAELAAGDVARTGGLRRAVAVRRHPRHFAEELADAVSAGGRPRQAAQRRRLRPQAGVAEPYVTDLVGAQWDRDDRIGQNTWRQTDRRTDTSPSRVTDLVHVDRIGRHRHAGKS